MARVKQVAEHQGMKVEAAIDLLTPGPFETARRDWRADPDSWRSRFLLTHLNPKLDGIGSPEEEAAVRAHWSEVADALERHFDELPKWKPRVDRLGRRH